MRLIEQFGQCAIWHDPRMDEFYCYVGQKLIRVCPSIGMAHEVLAGY